VNAKASALTYEQKLLRDHIAARLKTKLARANRKFKRMNKKYP